MKIKTEPIRTYGTQQRQSKEEFVSMSTYIKNIERSQINLMLHLTLLEKQEVKPKTSKWRINIRVKINKLETKKKNQ
jgi:hypothetical protein